MLYFILCTKIQIGGNVPYPVYHALCSSKSSKKSIGCMSENALYLYFFFNLFIIYIFVPWCTFCYKNWKGITTAMRWMSCKNVIFPPFWYILIISGTKSDNYISISFSRDLIISLLCDWNCDSNGAEKVCLLWWDLLCVHQNAHYRCAWFWYDAREECW